MKTPPHKAPRPANLHFSDFPLASSQANNFDLLRYLLAVLVIFSHSFPLMGGTNDHEPFWLVSRGQYTGGSIAVDLFLIISGFLVSQSWLRSDGPLPFIIKRLRRVYPGYLVAALFSLLLVWVIDSAGTAFLAAQAISLSLWVQVLALFTIPAIPGFLLDNPFPWHINGSLWTIKYEFGCYLFLVALGWLGLVRRRHRVLGLFLLCWAVYMFGVLNPFVDFASWPYRMYDWLRMLSCFLAGVSFYLYRDKIRFSGRYALICGLVATLLFVAGYGFVPMLPIVGAYVVFFLAFSQLVPGHAFGCRGDLSYGVYLYAFPVQQVLVHYIGGYLNPLSLFLLAWAITVLCAWASWTFVERPFLRRAA